MKVLSESGLVSVLETTLSCRSLFSIPDIHG